MYKQETRAFLQSFGKKIEQAFERCDSTGRDHVGVGEFEDAFRAFREHADVRKMQGSCGCFDEAGFFADGFCQDEFSVGQHNRKWDAREACAGAGIEYAAGIAEQLPGSDGIVDVFDGGVAGIEDARQVHVFIGGHDGFEVLRSLGHKSFAMGKIGGQNAVERFEEVHRFMMASG